MKLPDQIQREVLGAALVSYGTQAVIQCANIAQRHRGIVRKPLAGPRGLYSRSSVRLVRVPAI